MDFLSARAARREIFGGLNRVVYDLAISQPLAKYTIRRLEEKKKLYTERDQRGLVLGGFIFRSKNVIFYFAGKNFRLGK